MTYYQKLSAKDAELLSRDDSAAYLSYVKFLT
jgi:hypothetical protein